MRDNENRAKVAITLIWIIMGLDIVMGISSYLQLDLLYKIESGLDYTDQELNYNDTREAILGVLYIVFYAVSATVYIRWFRRAYFNLHQVRKDLSFGEGWAAGAWFVPILNLFRPYHIMKELYKKTDATLSENIEEYERNDTLLFVNLWWSLWVVTSIVSNVESRLARTAITLEDYIIISKLSIATTILVIPLAILAVKVIKDYASMERSLFLMDKQALNSDFYDLDLTKDNDILDSLE